jgi:microcystin-dependent protein
MNVSHEKYIKKIYGTLRLYNSTVSNWVPIRGNEIGDVKYSLRSDDHFGWLVCDGRSLSRETYSELFDIIGTTYGSNSGTTFNLPDCRGRVLGASGSGSGLTGRSAGTLLGTETHTMTTNQMPTHTHTGTTSSDGLHAHTGTTSTDGLHTHTSNANGGQGGLGLVTANGANTATDVDTSAGELNLWTLPAALTIDSNGSHNHTFTTITSGSHNHTFTTDSIGNSQAFNIMQPTAFIGYVFLFANHIE